MKQVYTASNLPDAHLMRDLLEQAGIAAHVFNAHAMGAMGELPMGAASPQVWITQLHQEQHARAVIADFEQRKPQTRTRQCPGCHETSPGEFDFCWSCGTALPADS
jgi:hypothetical protein